MEKTLIPILLFTLAAPARGDGEMVAVYNNPITLQTERARRLEMEAAASTSIYPIPWPAIHSAGLSFYSAQCSILNLGPLDQAACRNFWTQYFN